MEKVMWRERQEAKGAVGIWKETSLCVDVSCARLGHTNINHPLMPEA